MSCKDDQKPAKSKKASDVLSQRHEDKSAQSASSLSSHIQQLKNQKKRLDLHLQDANNSIEKYRQMMNQFMAYNDQLSREIAKNAEGELQLWQTTFVQILTKLQAVDARLREIYGSPEKARKKRNYVLQKVQQPPSDNE